MILDFSRLVDVLLNNRFWLAPPDCVLCAAVTFNNYRVSKKKLIPFIFKLAASRQEFDRSCLNIS